MPGNRQQQPASPPENRQHSPPPSQAPSVGHSAPNLPSPSHSDSGASPVPLHRTSPPPVGEDPPPFNDFLEADAGWQAIREELVKATDLVTTANTEMIRGVRERMRQALEREALDYKSKLKNDYREVYGDILALHRLGEDHVEWMREESWDFLQRVKEYARSSRISVDSLLAYHLPEVHVKRANLFNIFQQLKAEETPGLSRKEMTAAWEEAKAEHKDDMEEYEQMLRRQHLESQHAQSKKRNQGTVLRQVADQFGDMVCSSKP